MNIVLLSYILVPIAFIFMIKDYKHSNWIWLPMMLGGLFLGIGPYIALAYLAMSYKKQTPEKADASGLQTKSAITYHPDGSYTVYQVADTKNAPSAAKIAFRVVGGIIAGASIAVGLLFVGIILLFTLAPSIACGGSSKCM